MMQLLEIGKKIPEKVHSCHGGGGLRGGARGHKMAVNLGSPLGDQLTGGNGCGKKELHVDSGIFSCIKSEHSQKKKRFRARVESTQANLPKAEGGGGGKRQKTEKGKEHAIPGFSE